ncbi:hypothetical protein [Thiocystis violacea]|uniref:hypothetical protein n=1 Tax=Thiocystis violacea TaxID=13725 RepID=UPI0019088DD0|nr:hypothetical protein [Thiocystis violacea]MBK1723715.1 hypothetical protein [Thiocystis violacea]
MAKQFRNTPSGFDSDLDAILNRVYGSNTSGSDLGGNPTGIRQSFVHHEQDSQELKQALADLRNRREKSQNVMRMQEELQYLQQQVRKLKDLRQQIEGLRQQLDTEQDPL